MLVSRLKVKAGKAVSVKHGFIIPDILIFAFCVTLLVLLLLLYMFCPFIRHLFSAVELQYASPTQRTPVFCHVFVIAVLSACSSGWLST